MKGNQWVTEFVVGHLSQHIKDTVSFPSGLEYLHQEGSANFKPGYLYVILLLFSGCFYFFLYVESVVLSWDTWPCLFYWDQKKKSHISNPFFSLSGPPKKSLSNHLASPPPGGVCVLKSLAFLHCFHAAINLLPTLTNCFFIPNSVFISRNCNDFLCLQFFFFCSHILISWDGLW